MRNVLLRSDNQREFEDKGYSMLILLNCQGINQVFSDLQLMRSSDNFNPEVSLRRPSYHLTNFDDDIEYKVKAKQLISSILEPHK